MTEGMIAFVIWGIVGIAFILIGISALRSKTASGFWSNIKVYEVTDVKNYNREMGRLWIIYGLVFILLGVPLLTPEDTGWILLSVVGVVVETISIMIIYELKITPKYRKK